MGFKWCESESHLYHDFLKRIEKMRYLRYNKFAPDKKVNRAFVDEYNCFLEEFSHFIHDSSIQNELDFPNRVLDFYIQRFRQVMKGNIIIKDERVEAMSRKAVEYLDGIFALRGNRNYYTILRIPP